MKGSNAWNQAVDERSHVLALPSTSTCTTFCDTLRSPEPSRSNASTLPAPKAEQPVAAEPGVPLPRLDSLLAAKGRAGARAGLWCVDSGELRAMTTFQVWVALASGDIGTEARVWREGMECWLPVGDVSELSCAIPAQSGVRAVASADADADADAREEAVANEDAESEDAPTLRPASAPEPPEDDDAPTLLTLRAAPCPANDDAAFDDRPTVPVVCARPPAWVDDPRATEIVAAQPPAWQRTAPRTLVGVAAVLSLTLVVSAIAARPRRVPESTVVPTRVDHPPRRVARAHAEAGQHRLRASDRR